MAAASTNGQVAHLAKQVDIEDLSAGSDIFVTAKGFKLRIVPVPTDLLYEARDRIPLPKPPELPVKDDDGNVIPNKFDVNHMDPHFLQEMEEYNKVRNELSFKIMAAYGVVEYGIPEGFYGPQDAEWEDALGDEDIFGFDIGGRHYNAAPNISPVTKPRARLVDWLRNYVLAEYDVSPLTEMFIRGGGAVLEKDVETASENFRSSDERDANRELPAAPDPN